MSEQQKIPLDVTFKEEKNDGGKLSLTVEMTGAPDAVVNALVHGLPLEALEQINAALDAEMMKRRES